MSLHWPTTGHYWIIFPLLLRDKIFCIRQLPAARPQSLQIIRWQSGGRENWMEDGGWNVILLRHVSDDWYTRAFTMKESLETLLNMQLINKIAWTFNNHWWFCQQRSLKSPVNKNIWSLISGEDKLFKCLFMFILENHGQTSPTCLDLTQHISNIVNRVPGRSAEKV